MLKICISHLKIIKTFNDNALYMKCIHIIRPVLTLIYRRTAYHELFVFYKYVTTWFLSQSNCTGMSNVLQNSRKNENIITLTNKQLSI